jgi:hypothetical protein
VGFGAVVLAAALIAHWSGWEAALLSSAAGSTWWFVLDERGDLRRVIDDPGTVRLGFSMLMTCLAVIGLSTLHARTSAAHGPTTDASVGCSRTN